MSREPLSFSGFATRLLDAVYGGYRARRRRLPAGLIALLERARLARWLADRVRPSGFRLMPVNVGGASPLRLYLPAGFHWVSYDGYEPALMSLLNRIVSPGMSCVDAGAHIGVITCLLARRVGPRGRVVAFEPNPENAALLERNLAINGFGAWASVDQSALADGQSSSVEFTSEGGYSTQGRIGLPSTGAKPSTVRAVGLDQWLDRRPEHPHPQFIKIDVEGAGTGVISGMQRSLATHRPVLVFEVHGKAEWVALESLAGIGYVFADVSGELRTLVTIPEVQARRSAISHLVCWPSRP